MTTTAGVPGPEPGPTTIDSRFPSPTSSGTVATRGGRTWYRVTGDLDAITPGGPAPLVVLHGGPGAGHQYTLMMANLARDGRVVVHYDQIGCGASTHLPDAPADFWTVELFVEELRDVVQALGITDRFHLLGQSWGGMLGPEVVLANSAGIRSLTLCDSPASMELWIDATAELRAELPGDVQATLSEHEAADTTDSASYEQAMQVFYDRYVCRVVPNPVEVHDSFMQLAAEPTVYHTMNGPSEFHVTGSLRGWSVVDRLHRIHVPTLVVAGCARRGAPRGLGPVRRAHPRHRLARVPHLEPHAARRGAGRVPRPGGHVPAPSRLTGCAAGQGRYDTGGSVSTRRARSVVAGTPR